MTSVHSCNIAYLSSLLQEKHHAQIQPVTDLLITVCERKLVEGNQSSEKREPGLYLDRINMRPYTQTDRITMCFCNCKYRLCTEVHDALREIRQIRTKFRVNLSRQGKIIMQSKALCQGSIILLLVFFSENSPKHSFLNQNSFFRIIFAVSGLRANCMPTKLQNLMSEIKWRVAKVSIRGDRSFGILSPIESRRSSS